MKIVCNKSNPPLGGLLAVEHYRSQAKNIEVVWGAESTVTLPNAAKPVPYGTSNDLLRIVENAFNKSTAPLNRVVMNHWLSFSLILDDEIPKSLDYLDKTLGPITYLVGETLSVSDLAVFSVLYVSNKLKNVSKEKTYNNIVRWMKLIQAQSSVVNALKEFPNDALQNLIKMSSRSSPPANTEPSTGRQQEGKFVELPNAEMGKVVVRFPPEASGFLHIGHAKAALLNQYYQEAFKGKLIMRFDDTNPAKENADFEKVILEDVEMLEIKPDMFTHTSQYFDLMQQLCEKLIKEGKAFVDDTPGDQMKNEREQQVDSKNRNNSVEKNFQLWEEMKKGSAVGVQCCVRAKIDMQSPNGCLRDPTVYRCKPEPHPRTGTKYKVYPTYDFACPIVDSIEGVTHVLRTMEYHDRDTQFYWFIDALGLRKPYIWEYSRLSMTNTVLSKRKLTWFVEQGLVDGWDDPRMPTVRGVLRRGMSVEGLRQFIAAQGSSRSVVFMEWDKIWAINKKVIDPVAPRYTSLEKNPVPVNLSGVSESQLSVALHPKNPDVGTKTVWVSKRLLIDQVDAKSLKEGENATFINYGNVMINKIHKSADGTVTSIDGTPNLDNKDYKKTLKLTWLADTPQSPQLEVYCVYFDHILSKPVLGKDEDFKKYIGHTTRWEVPMVGEPALASVKVGDVIQLQRRGFFRVDVAASDVSPHTGRKQPLVLLHVPDGHTKEMPGQPKPVSTTSAAKQPSQPRASPAGDYIQLDKDIKELGESIRSLKASGAPKNTVNEAVKKLLELKEQYHKVTQLQWPNTPAPVNQVPSGDEAARLSGLISAQGQKVRQLKADKAEKSVIDIEVNNLKNLKAQYKSVAGKEWSPTDTAPTAPAPAANMNGDAASIAADITRQGEVVRDLKTKKADKATIDVEVKKLLALKAQYQEKTGTAYQPTAAPVKKAVQASTAAPAGNSGDAASIAADIAKQGDVVRDLKTKKADKATVDVEVKKLLALKAQYQEKTGTAYQPPSQAPAASAPSKNGEEAAIAADIAKQGDVVRDLKTKKADKPTIDAEVKKLLDLKTKYQEKTGTAYQPPTQARGAKPKETKPAEAKPKEAKKEAKKEKPKEQSPKPAAAKGDETASGPKKITRLGLEASKDTDLPEWYSQVITKSEMIDYYDISGCYILRPWSYSIWDQIRGFLSPEFRKLGAKDGYFPIFVSKAALEREKAHIADFAPEVAWVTASGDSELAEHIAIRPTSETAMYPAFARWIQSHRDLPYKLNQWNNVVRWEFKQPQPFLRTREFLWQEGHTAFRTAEEAGEEVLAVLELYRRVYEELLAVPVVCGRKTEKEKFAGSAYTTTVEGFVPASGRGIQGATSHHLGQNFSKMFEVVYDDPDTHEKAYVYQNSWGMTTRTIGVMVLVHGDDKGLVLPPRVAEIQVIIVPCGITASTGPADRAALIESCKILVGELVSAGVRAEGDYRDNYSPGWKFNHWELKGVPIRVELGPKDIAKGEVVAVRRLNGEKLTLKRDGVAERLTALLDTTQADMLTKATKERDEKLSTVTKWEDFTAALERKNILLSPFCGEIDCEDNIKKDSRIEDETDTKAPAMGAKSLCIPFKQPRDITSNDRCIHPACKKKPKFFTLFGRSY